MMREELYGGSIYSTVVPYPDPQSAQNRKTGGVTTPKKQHEPSRQLGSVWYDTLCTLPFLLSSHEWIAWGGNALAIKHMM